MKPKTDLEREALRLSQTLDDSVLEHQLMQDRMCDMSEDLYSAAMDDIGYNGYARDYPRRMYGIHDYQHVIQRVEGWTVMRTWQMEQRWRLPYAWQWERVSEIAQQWIAPSGERITIAKNKGVTRALFGDWDYWNHGSKMSVKRRADHRMRYIYYQYFVGDDLGNIFVHSVADGFFRSDIVSLDERLGYFTTRTSKMLHTYYPDVWGMACINATIFHKVEQYERQIFLASRNHYDWTADMMQWFDMLDMMRYCNGQMEDVRHICPKDFKAEHDYWMERANNKRRREEYERKIRENEERQERDKKAELRYQREKAKYLVIAFGNDEYDFKVIQNVEQFKQIGREHRQCIYGCGYYNHEDDVLLVCSKHGTGEYVSTVTVNINLFKVTTNLGHCNKNLGEEGERINRIVAENMQLFRDAKRAMQQCRDERDSRIEENTPAIEAPALRLAM